MWGTWHEAAYSAKWKMTSYNTNDQWQASIYFTIGHLKCIIVYHWSFVLYDVIFIRYHKLLFMTFLVLVEGNALAIKRRTLHLVQFRLFRELPDNDVRSQGWLSISWNVKFNNYGLINVFSFSPYYYCFLIDFFFNNDTKLLLLLYKIILVVWPRGKLFIIVYLVHYCMV